jgi:hypothetical protein
LRLKITNMEYENVMKVIEDEKFCDPIKSTNLSSDLTELKTVVIPALLNRIKDLEAALQRDSEKMFNFKNSLEEL